MNKKQSQNQGYTLLELLIVISTIAFLSVSGIAAYNQYNRTQVFNSAVSDVVLFLETAKARAQAQIKPPTGSLCNPANANVNRPLFAFRVIRVNATTLRMQAVCNNNLPNPQFRTHDFTPDLRTPNNSNITLIVHNYDGTLNNSLFINFFLIKGGATPARILVQQSGFTTKRITIKADGRISVTDN